VANRLFGKKSLRTVVAVRRQGARELGLVGNSTLAHAVQSFIDRFHSKEEGKSEQKAGEEPRSKAAEAGVI
jgi:hypothetical protein